MYRVPTALLTYQCCGDLSKISVASKRVSYMAWNYLSLNLFYIEISKSVASLKCCTIMFKISNFMHL